jgi:hypothetical protein
MRSAGALKERDITAQIKGFMESRGWYGVRLQSGTVRGVTRGTFMHLGKKGLPDYVFVRARECCFVEIKAPGKRPSKDQEMWFAFADIQGIQHIWADGLDAFTEKYRRLFTR